MVYCSTDREARVMLCSKLKTLCAVKDNHEAIKSFVEDNKDHIAPCIINDYIPVVYDVLLHQELHTVKYFFALAQELKVDTKYIISHQGFMAFDWAVWSGKVEVAEYVYDLATHYNIDIEAMFRCREDIVLYLAIGSGEFELLEFVLKKAEDLNIEISEMIESIKYSAFREAASSDIEVLKLITSLAIEGGLDVALMLEALDYDAFLCAVRSGKIENIKFRGCPR